MKNRQSKEVKQTQELFKQFRELKSKLVRQVEQHKLHLPELEAFRELELQFVLDLNLLSVDMLTARRNSINKAIDEIMMIESSLHLRILKRNSHSQEAQAAQSVNKSVSSAAQQPMQKVEQDVITSTKQPVRRPEHRNLPPSNDYLDPEEITSIRNQYIFDHEELQGIWGKYRSPDSQGSEDKLDRMAKAVAAIRRDIKHICDKEKHANKNQGLHDNKHHSELIKQLEEQRQTIKELERKNLELEEEIARMRVATPKSKATSAGEKTIGTVQFDNEQVQTLFSNDQFRIVKIQPLAKHTRHGSLERVRSAPEASYESVVKYAFLLQEKIVDELRVAPQALRSSQTTLLAKQTNSLAAKQVPPKAPPAPQTFKKLPPAQDKPTRHIVSTGDLPKESPTNVVEQTQNLRDMGAKLQEIRKQRKKIFEDDIWDEIENIKL